MSDAQDMCQAVGMFLFSGGCRFAGSFSKEILTRDRFNREKGIPMVLLEFVAQPGRVNLFGVFGQLFKISTHG
jgi:hypothetical protein